MFNAMENKKYRCCLCGKENCGFGNNPQPIENVGRCCDDCNAKYVIPTRLMMQTLGASSIREVQPEAKRFYHYLKNKNESTIFGNDESNTTITEDTKDTFLCYAWANMNLDYIEEFYDEMLAELDEAGFSFPSVEISPSIFSVEEMLELFIEDEEGSEHGQAYFDFSISCEDDEVEEVLQYLQERMDIASLSGARFSCLELDIETDYTQFS